MSKESKMNVDLKIYQIRHSLAHIMAQAVSELFEEGEAKIAIGPPIENGFYYDFALPRALTPEDFKTIEKGMRKIINQKLDFVKEVVSADEARKIFAGQPFKLELIEGLEEGQFDADGNALAEGGEISVFRDGTFVDLCAGPHVGNTSEIDAGAFKLMNVAGAYWRGDEKREQLQRIYAVAFESKEELKEYLWRMEEAKKRDHRKLGKDLDLFSVNDEVGQGLILWHPNGGMMRKLAEDFWGDEHEKHGYEFVYTPHIGKAELWQTSGHLDFYKEGMYSAIDVDGQEYYLKPMNCPFHIHIYKSQLRSYRDLPLRYAEKGTVYRYERSGTLQGLFRVRGFTQDDAHHFCRPDQMDEELDFVLNFSLNILRGFGLKNFKAYLSTKPEKAVGKDEDWAFAEAALEQVLVRNGMAFEVDEGGGAFYGPKIDLGVEDALGREWQISTVQFDFNLPERFDISYVGTDGEAHRPYMLHRALLGSMERFFGILIEHYAGAFPVWLAAQQAVLIPITDRHVAYCDDVAKELRKAGLRVRVDDGGERMNAKIRTHTKRKVPYLLVVGDEEMEAGSVALRLRNGENVGVMSVDDFAVYARREIEERV